MKSYNHLWEKLISDENILLAIQNATKGKMKRKKLTEIKKNSVEYIPIIKNWIIEFEPFEHTPKVINDGISAKKRTIIVPTVKEHIIQHAIMNVLKPIFMKGMYEHSYASIPKRGCHKGKKYVQKWIYNDTRNIKYCLKLDIKKYFENISQQILINELRQIIHDKKFVELLVKIISTTKQGLPLGFYTSQWLANWYLQNFDHYVKEVLRVKHYIRYMDDMILFGSNKRELHKIKDSIKNYLDKKLKLTIKENWQIFRFHTSKNKGRFLDFMGFRFYRNRITLRRKIALKAQRKAKKIFKKKRATIQDARQMMTYVGWAKHTNCYTWFKTHILPYVNIRQLRKIISKYDRRRSLCGINQNQALSQCPSTAHLQRHLYMLEKIS